ncbi:MAG: YceI family protein [Verrucomicrobia bacterium]|nr:YceI family protein [Verrucomicrobiota bacterium]
MKTKNQLFIGSLALCLGFSLQAADTIKYEALPTGSEMKLDGDSTAHKWHCIGKIIGGSFEVEAAWQKDLSLKSVTCLGAGKTPPKCEISIPVRTLKSQVAVASTTMDNRMYAELKAKEFPRIEYKLTEMTVKGEVPASGSPVTFDTKGTLVVAGATNKVSFPITMERVGDSGLKFTGVMETTMKNLGVTPPEFTIMGVGLKTANEIKMTWTWQTAIKKE